MEEAEGGGRRVGSVVSTCSHTSSQVSFQRDVQPSRLTARVVYVAPGTYGWPSPTAQEKLPPPCSSKLSQNCTNFSVCAAAWERKTKM